MKKTKLLTGPTAAFGGVVRSPRSILLPVQALELANIYLENACDATDPIIALTLCHDTEVTLSQAKSGSKSTDHHPLRESIANAYIELGRLLDGRGHCKEAQASYKKADKMG
ncbi:hypothetical protein B0O80DRAFT_425208 [Mortierella sp. GBAus27b]|nr:hypothetical protein B0O80DRAFT_425208 [Mortierella sp. GBAus27b]